MSARIVRTEMCGGWADESLPGFAPGTPVVIVDAETWERATSLLERYTRSVHHDALDAETERFLATLQED